MKPAEMLGHVIMLCICTATIIVGQFNKQLAFSLLVACCIVFGPLVLILFNHKDKNDGNEGG